MRVFVWEHEIILIFDRQVGHCRLDAWGAHETQNFAGSDGPRRAVPEAVTKAPVMASKAGNNAHPAQSAADMSAAHAARRQRGRGLQDLGVERPVSNSSVPASNPGWGFASSFGTGNLPSLWTDTWPPNSTGILAKGIERSR